MDKRGNYNYIEQIVKHGNLSKAAGQIGISQPALSSWLTSLENELGFKIFNRKRVPITFTPEGKLYYDYIKKAEVLANDFKKRLSGYQKEATSKVIIGGPVAYVESLVTDAVIALRRKRPNYQVAIKCSPLPKLIDMAAKGEINCFISTREDIPKNFQKQLIKQEKLYLCIPSSNPINKDIAAFKTQPGKNEKCIDFSMLDGEGFIFLEEGQPLREQMESFFYDYGITPNCNIIVNQVAAAVSMAIKGEGICIASEYALSGNMNLDNLCIYSLPESISGRSIYIAYNKELFMPAAANELIEHLLNI